MTVTTTANSILYAGNGTVKAFAFPYIFFAPSDLHVTLVDAAGATVTPPPVLNGAATYDYTVTGVVTHGEYASGGTVTFVTAPPAGYTVSLVRAVPALQTVTLIDNTKFPADTVNTEFDYLTVLAQQTSAVTTVALHIPDNEVGLDVEADPAASRANKFLTWDSAGNLSHSTKNVEDVENVDISHFDELYVNTAGDTMSGPLFVPFLTASNATVSTGLQVTPGGTAKAPTPPANDVSTNLATTAWVVGFLGSQGQGEAVYKFHGSTVAGDPGTGNMIIQIGSGIDRQIALSRVDADGVNRFLTAMKAGDAIVVTNEFTPVTAYARYTLITNVTDHSTWVEFGVHLNDSSSPAEAPPLNTRLRVTGFLNTMNGGAAISGVSAGYGLTGGGNSGVIPIAADPAILAPLANPVFTGDPKAPTPVATDNDTSIATTKFVKDQGYTSVAASDAAYLKLSGGTLTGPLVGTQATLSSSLTAASVAAIGAVTAQSTTAIPAGGTLGAGYMLSSTANFGITFGSGVPNKAMAQGSFYLRSDGGGAPYYNSDGTGAGWTQIGSGGASTYVGTSPPPIPTDGQLWFWTDDQVGGGALYIRYNDAFGAPQWVPASPAATPGSLIQTVFTETGAVATGTTTMSSTDVIPNIANGDQYMALAITPRSATSKLIIEVTWIGAHSAAPGMLVAALFQDSTANALAANGINYPAASFITTIRFTHTMISGTTSATTFRVRVGGNQAGTTTFNGTGGTRYMGGVSASSIVIQEVA